MFLDGKQGVLDAQNPGLWMSNASGKTSNKSGGGHPIAQPGRSTDLLDVRQTHWTPRDLAGRPGGFWASTIDPTTHNVPMPLALPHL